jgi:hypothetical protein
MATKTNINLIVNGAKVYTRKTTGRPYTHALVTGLNGKWSIISCSSKGIDALQRTIDEARKTMAWYDARLTAETESDWAECWRVTRETIATTDYRILPIIDNTVTLNA